MKALSRIHRTHVGMFKLWWNPALKKSLHFRGAAHRAELKIHIARSIKSQYNPEARRNPITFSSATPTLLAGSCTRRNPNGNGTIENGSESGQMRPHWKLQSARAAHVGANVTGSHNSCPGAISGKCHPCILVSTFETNSIYIRFVSGGLYIKFSFWWIVPKFFLSEW